MNDLDKYARAAVGIVVVFGLAMLWIIFRG